MLLPLARRRHGISEPHVSARAVSDMVHAVVCMVIAGVCGHRQNILLTKQNRTSVLLNAFRKLLGGTSLLKGSSLVLDDTAGDD